MFVALIPEKEKESQIESLVKEVQMGKFVRYTQYPQTYPQPEPGSTVSKNKQSNLPSLDILG